MPKRARGKRRAPRARHAASRRPLRRVLTALLLVAGALALYAVVLAFVWWRQENIMFYPAPLPADYPLAREPDIHERSVEVDGATLSVMHLQ